MKNYLFMVQTLHPPILPISPFSYHHQTTLREFTAEEFKEEVLSQPLAGNVDEPEGGLDALMQAMVCRQRVGWRQNARKIILMATDREGDNIFKCIGSNYDMIMT